MECDDFDFDELPPAPQEADPNSKRSQRKAKRQESKIRKWGKKPKVDRDDAAAKTEVLENEKAPSSARSLRKRAAFLTKLEDAATVVLDCEWEPSMSDKELKSLTQQIMHAYGSNKIATHPLNLAATGVQPGGAQDRGLRKISGFEDWMGFRCEQERYISLFPQDKLIYLSADAEEVMETIEKDKVYIIGGIVDRNRLKGITHAKAIKQGIRTVRLPIPELVNIGNRKKILTITSVFNLMLELFANGGDMYESLRKICPANTMKERPAVARRGENTMKERPVLAGGDITMKERPAVTGGDNTSRPSTADTRIEEEGEKGEEEGERKW